MAKPNLKQTHDGSSSSRVGNYQSRNIIGSITAALLLIGAFTLFALHTNRLTKVIQSNVEIQVILENGLDVSDSLRIVKLLASQPFVLKVNGQPKIKYVSKEEALEKLSQELKEDILANTIQNPLRNSFIINILPTYHKEDKLSRIKEQLEQEPGIFEVSYAVAAIEKIDRNIRVIGIIVFTLVALLILLTGFFVHTAIKLALYSQRFIIRSMQLVGASDAFIKKPFVIRAGLYGMLSGVIASALLTGGLFWLYDVLPEFKQVKEWSSTLLIFLSLLLIGAFIAAMSAFFAVSKYLNRSLDELHQR
jgi:cell division transport system permease protein